MAKLKVSLFLAVVYISRATAAAMEAVSPSLRERYPVMTAFCEMALGLGSRVGDIIALRLLLWKLSTRIGRAVDRRSLSKDDQKRRHGVLAGVVIGLLALMGAGSGRPDAGILPGTPLAWTLFYFMFFEPNAMGELWDDGLYEALRGSNAWGMCWMALLHFIIFHSREEDGLPPISETIGP